MNLFIVASECPVSVCASVNNSLKSSTSCVKENKTLYDLFISFFNQIGTIEFTDNSTQKGPLAGPKIEPGTNLL